MALSEDPNQAAVGRKTEQGQAEDVVEEGVQSS